MNQKTDFRQPTPLGRTGLSVGRLGISSSYGAPAAAFEEAFEKGCNYFTLGTFIRGRSSEMTKAVHHICQKGEREKLVLAWFTYAHNNFLADVFLNRGLKATGAEYVDVLLLGYYSKVPPKRLLEGALRLKESGRIRYVGISSHNRRLFPELRRQGIIDVFHVRYNAAHRGAETEVFPYLEGEDRPGIVSFTATRWKRLLNPRKMPPGEPPMTAAECYRFVLSNPAVDVCMMGAKTLEQMRENLKVLEAGPMSEEEMARAIRIGDHVHGA